MRSIRGGMGLGDAIYVQAVARHLVNKGERLRICTAWPDVFRPLNGMVTFAPFTRQGIQILAHYSMRKGHSTKQFTDCCLAAGILDPVEFKLDWEPTSIIELPKPYICVQLPRSPMGRSDGFGKELMPDCSVIQKAIDRIKGRATIVQIGSGKPIHTFTGIDIDLANKTTVCQLFDIALGAEGFLGYVSFIIPLAEALNKKALLVWSSRGLKAGHQYVRRITPEKVLYRDSSRWIMDTATEGDITKAVDDLLQ